MKQRLQRRALSRYVLFVIGLVGLVVACRRIEEPLGPITSDRYALLYTANHDGEIEPCG